MTDPKANSGDVIDRLFPTDVIVNLRLRPWRLRNSPCQHCARKDAHA